MFDRRIQYRVVILLCIVTAVVFARSAFFPFNLLDDGAYVTRNDHVMQGLSVETIRWAFTSVYQYNWIPLTWLSFALDAHLFGGNPMGYHVINILLHVANVSLLFFLLERMTGQFWRSLLAAALFALHPLRVESVAWIAERKDVLSTFFWMLTLIWYVSYARSRNFRLYLLSLAAFTLGLLSKQMLITVPAVLLLMDFWPLRRLSFPPHPGEGAGAGNPSMRQLLVEKVPFLLLAATATGMAFYANYVSRSIKSTELIPVGERVVNALWYLVNYLWKMAFPLNLAIVYPTVEEPLWKGLAAAVFIGAVLLLAFRKLHRMPYLAVGFLFYLVTVFPVLGLIQVGTVAVADRYVYVPLIGIFIALSWGAGDLVSRWPHLRTATVTMIGAAIAGYTALTTVQLSYWKDDVTLLRHALEVTEENHVAHENLGIAYADAGKPDLALEQFHTAMRIGPECPELHVCLGNLLDGMGRLEEAAGEYAAATRISPGKIAAHLLHARALQKLGRLREAISEYEQTIAVDPQNPLLHENAGLAYLQAGELNESISHFSTALSLDPSSNQTRSNLQYAQTLKSQGPQAR